MQELHLFVGWGAIGLGILLDVVSSFCEVRYAMRGSGPSGLPIVSAVLYVFPGYLLIGLAGIILLLLFHIIAHLAIPWLAYAVLDRRQQ